MKKSLSIIMILFIISTTISIPIILLSNLPTLKTIQYFSITSKCSVGGVLIPLGNITVKEGEHKEFFITPNESHLIEDVIINGTSLGIIDFFNFTNVNSNQTIEVLFIKKTFIIEIASNSNGTTIPSQSEILEYGDNKKIKDIYLQLKDIYLQLR